MVTRSSKTSLVVPASFDTMARSKPAIRFRSVLFPTLGLPTIAAGTPLSSFCPESYPVSSSESCLLTSMIPDSSRSLSASSTSSSGKSISAAICVWISRSCVFSSSVFFARDPSAREAAAFSPSRETALISSITASASVSPILPFRKALLVNSPFPAGSAPAS